jgi:cytochrome c-type biogenesis protein CcmH/NrfG
MATVAVVVAIGVPALAFVLWPLLSRRDRGRAFLPVPPDAREQLTERKRQVLRALRELEFEHDAGHVSDEDHAELRARYEGEAAEILLELDRLGAMPAPVPAPAVEAAAAPRRRGWRHPAAIAAGAAALLVFGIAIGAGIVRYTEPDATAGMPPPGSRPLAAMPGGGAPAPGAPQGSGRPLTPELLQGMLGAARASLAEGRYGEAIAAYQAVLKRDPRNVDAMTHLGLIVAIGGHDDAALETFDRALAIDPRYAPALLYRGQVLYENKGDVKGAVEAWEKFLAVTPPGEDRQRVEQMIADAKSRPAPTQRRR